MNNGGDYGNHSPRVDKNDNSNNNSINIENNNDDYENEHTNNTIINFS